MNNDEIEELKKALAASPDNNFLRLMLIKKMQHLPAYEAELDQLLQEAMKLSPDNLELKGILISNYFKQEKLSACIVIAESIGDLTKLPLDIRSIIAKCYLRDGDKSNAKDLYESIINEDRDYEDDELDG